MISLEAINMHCVCVCVHAKKWTMHLAPMNQCIKWITNSRKKGTTTTISTEIHNTLHFFYSLDHFKLIHMHTTRYFFFTLPSTFKLSSSISDLFNLILKRFVFIFCSMKIFISLIHFVRPREHWMKKEQINNKIWYEQVKNWMEKKTRGKKAAVNIDDSSFTDREKKNVSITHFLTELIYEWTCSCQNIGKYNACTMYMYIHL